MAPTHASLNLDQRGDGLYSGTFRWTDKKTFIELPTNQSLSCDSVSLKHGWGSYLDSRDQPSVIPPQPSSKPHSKAPTTPKTLLQRAKEDPSFLDALSFPMTLIHTIQRLDLVPSAGVFNLVVIGASVKAEQRILNITSYWNELAIFFPEHEIHLWLTGPEINNNLSPTSTPYDCATSHQCPSNLSIHLYRGTAGQVLLAQAFDASRTVLIGYNTGFGNFVESQRYELFWSWLADLEAIAKSNLPTIFTCANDYADMQGEFAVQSRIIGANFLLLPSQNVFSAASHLHAPGQAESSYSRGNSFLYVIRGFDNRRRYCLLFRHTLRGTTLLETRLAQPLTDPLWDALGRGCLAGENDILSSSQVQARQQLSKSPVLSQRGKGEKVRPHLVSLTHKEERLELQQ